MGVVMDWGRGAAAGVDVGLARCATRGVAACVVRGMLGDALLAAVEAVRL